MTRTIRSLFLPLLLGATTAYADQVVLSPGAHPCIVRVSQDNLRDVIRAYPSGAPNNASYYFGYKLLTELSRDSPAEFKKRWDALLGRCELAYPSGSDPWLLHSPADSRKTVLQSGTVVPPTDSVIADFTGDGILDALHLDSARFLFQQGQAGGTLGTGTQRTFGNDTTSWGFIEAADVNGDGRLDAILCCGPPGANPRVGIALGAGNGTFAAPTASINANVISVRDWNGDGRADLISATVGAISISLGQANGTFQTTYQTPFAATKVLAVADVNNDNILDVIALQDASFSVYPGLPDGTLGFKQTFELAFNGATTMTIADLNADHFPDIAVFDSVRGAGQYWRGTGTGLFFEPVTLFSTMAFDRATAEDLDADGRPELLLPGGPAGTVTIAPLLPNGELRVPPLYRLRVNGLQLQAAPTAATVADFTNDGIADVVLAGANLVTIFQGGGSIQHLVPISGPLSQSGISVLAPGDFNGDGFMDLAAVDGPRLHQLTGSGNGGFGALFTPLTFTPRDLAIADFNGDGKADAALAGGGGVSISLSAGSAFQAPTTYFTSAPPLRLAVGDFNGDQRPDVAYIAFGTAGMFLNQAGGGFSTVVPLAVPSNFQLTTIQAGDVNGDGKTDLLIGGIFQNQGPLLVLLGNGAGAFTPLLNQSGIDEFIQDIKLTDLDHDGRTDLVMAHCCGDLAVTYAYGNGNGTFSRTVRVPTGQNPSRVWLVDLNGDEVDEWVTLAEAGVSVMPAPSGAFRQIANVNAASGKGPEVASQSIVSAYGSQLSTLTAGTVTASETTLADRQVWVTDRDGNGGAAILFYVSPGLINYVLPPGLVNGPAHIAVESSNGLVAEGDITIVNSAPGILVFNEAGLAAANIVRVKPGGINLTEDVFQLQAGSIVPKPISFGAATDNLVVVLYGTGIRGRTSLNNTTVTIGGVALTPVYAGVQSSYPGLDQINVNLPRSLAGRGKVNVTVTVDGSVSNVTTLTFE